MKASVSRRSDTRWHSGNGECCRAIYANLTVLGTITESGSQNDSYQLNTAGGLDAGGSMHGGGSDVGYGNMTINGTGSGGGWAGGYSNHSSEGTTTESNWTSSSGYSYSGWSSGWDDATDTNGYGYQDGWDETYSYGWGSGSQWGSGGTASGSNTDDSGSSWGWTMYSGGAWYSGSGSDSTSSSGSYSESISSPGFYYGGGLSWSPFATGGQGLGYGMSAPGTGSVMGPTSQQSAQPQWGNGGVPGAGPTGSGLPSGPGGPGVPDLTNPSVTGSPSPGETPTSLGDGSGGSGSEGPEGDPGAAGEAGGSWFTRLSSTLQDSPRRIADNLRDKREAADIIGFVYELEGVDPRTGKPVYYAGSTAQELADRVNRNHPHGDLLKDKNTNVSVREVYGAPDANASRRLSDRSATKEALSAAEKAVMDKAGQKPSVGGCLNKIEPATQANAEIWADKHRVKVGAKKRIPAAKLREASGALGFVMMLEKYTLGTLANAKQNGRSYWEQLKDDLMDIVREERRAWRRTRSS